MREGRREGRREGFREEGLYHMVFILNPKTPSADNSRST